MYSRLARLAYMLSTKIGGAPDSHIHAMETIIHGIISV
jgi:hypothetical protein